MTDSYKTNIKPVEPLIGKTEGTVEVPVAEVGKTEGTSEIPTGNVGKTEGTVNPPSGSEVGKTEGTLEIPDSSIGKTEGTTQATTAGKTEGEVVVPGTDIGKTEGPPQKIAKTKGTVGKTEGTVDIGKTEGTVDVGKTEGTIGKTEGFVDVGKTEGTTQVPPGKTEGTVETPPTTADSSAQSGLKSREELMDMFRNEILELVALSIEVEGYDKVLEYSQDMKDMPQKLSFILPEHSKYHLTIKYKVTQPLKNLVYHQVVKKGGFVFKQRKDVMTEVAHPNDESNPHHVCRLPVDKIPGGSIVRGTFPATSNFYSDGKLILVANWTIQVVKKGTEPAMGQ
ncbi:hypothetical protein CLIB1444_02S10902 [[Candida] jaroonii]|uniref:Uncharacterized protein n=1 Tax=[Candida] jaroonii TaxID=467808 RepID=A0ACA9Y463_9ASCO|nr:hypothetical protein CLIB1444_02S10902 [[Candida] jaroonii]